ncbi:MAG: hypothetical protein ABJA57_04265 [Ginsengibacter sp.]
MKKIIIWIVIFCLSSFQSKAQYFNTTTRLLKINDTHATLNRAHTQKLFACILAVTGAGLITTGLAIKSAPADSWSPDFGGLRAIPIVAGAVGIMGSLALFNSAARHKRHVAIAIKSEMVETTSFVQEQSMVALSLKINY